MNEALPSPSSMSVLSIIGSGAMGSLFAAFLEPYTNLTMLSHWPEQIMAVSKHGLHCEHTDGSVTKHSFAITAAAHRLQPLRLALILVKSHQTARIAYDLAAVLAPEGLVITLQNGLGNLEMLTAALGHGRVVQGVTAQGATMVSAGQVRHAGHGMTYVANAAGRQQIVSGLVELLNRAGIPAETTTDVKSLQWGKLAINAGINALTAILRVPNGFLVENERASRVMCDAATESAAVAAKLNIALPYADAPARVKEVARATGNNYSSMLQDIVRGAPTEINAINGAVAEFGRQVNLPTPVNDQLWRMVTAIEAQPRPVGPLDADELLNKLLVNME